VLLRVRQSIGAGSGRDHHRPRAAVRHADRAFVHDAIRGHASGAVVLVATTRTPAPGQHHASPVRAASRGPSTAAMGRRGPRSNFRLTLPPKPIPGLKGNAVGPIWLSGDTRGRGRTSVRRVFLCFRETAPGARTYSPKRRNRGLQKSPT